MDHPVITIGGRDFPVPPLSIGQLKFVGPAMLRLKTMNLEALTEDNVSDLSLIVYLAILRGTPTFPRAEFDNMPGTIEQLLIAYPTIAQQCGMMRKEADQGEAPAGK
jgi:hypothetical protein